MAEWPAFVQGAYRSQSVIFAGDRCVNLYAESGETSGEVKAKSALYPTPGLEQFVALTGQPVSQLFELNGRCFAIAGNVFPELFANGTAIVRGLVAPGLARPSFASNGTAGGQLFITSGGFGYIFTLATNTLTLITDVNFPTGMATNGWYVDGYFVVQVQGTTQWQISALNDGLTWSGLDVAQRSFAQDSIVALAVSHREVWLFGSQTSEVWYNSGATFPFQPITGVFLEEGCAAQDSVAVLGPFIFWVSQNTQGARKVLRCGQGYTPVRVSTHAIEYALQGYDSIADAVGYGYQDQGHEFYVLTIPSQEVTWVFDNTTGLWHERGFWQTLVGTYTAQRAICHTYAFGKHLVGDRATSTVWDQDIRYPTDGDEDQVIRRMRTGVHLSRELKQIFYDALQLDMEVGVGGIAFDAIEDPQVMLRYSDDGGQTWSNERRVSAGKIGQYRTRVRWRQLGRGRDRVFEIAVSDGVPWRFVNAYIEARPGVS